MENLIWIFYGVWFGIVLIAREFSFARTSKKLKNAEKELVESQLIATRNKQNAAEWKSDFEATADELADVSAKTKEDIDHLNYLFDAKCKQYDELKEKYDALVDQIGDLPC